MKRICKFGKNCRDRSACSFRHVDDIPCKFGDQCAKVPQCPYRHDGIQSESIQCEEIIAKKKLPRKKPPKRSRAIGEDAPIEAPQSLESNAAHNATNLGDAPAGTDQETVREEEMKTSVTNARKPRRRNKKRNPKSPPTQSQQEEQDVHEEPSSTIQVLPDSFESTIEHQTFDQPVQDLRETTLPSDSTVQPKTRRRKKNRKPTPHQPEPQRVDEEHFEPERVEAPGEQPTGVPTTHATTTEPGHKVNRKLKKNPKKPKRSKKPMKTTEEQEVPQENSIGDDEGPPPNQADLMEQLLEMGFHNQVAVEKALKEAKYRLDRTINALLLAREADILRIQEATRTSLEEATDALAKSNGDVLMAIRRVREHQRANMQFASAAELETAVFITNRQRKKERAARRKTAKKQRKRLRKARLRGDITTKASKRSFESNGFVENAPKVEIKPKTEQAQSDPLITADDSPTASISSCTDSSQTMRRVDGVQNTTNMDDTNQSGSIESSASVIDMNLPSSENEVDMDHQSETPVTDGSSEEIVSSTLETESPPVEDQQTEDTDVTDSLEEKKRLWREELRLQKEKAAEKRAKQKRRRHEQYLAAQQAKMDSRTKYWDDFVKRQDSVMDLMVKLCVAEFCSKNDAYQSAKVSKMSRVQSVLQQTCRTLVSEFETLPKVTVEHKAPFGGRTGTIEYWDGEQQKFCVSLRSKKTKSLQKVFIAPENLDAEPSSEPTYHRSKDDRSVSIEIPSLVDGIDFSTVIFHSEIKILLEAKSVQKALAGIILGRREEERLAREREDILRQEEEKMRARRQRQREREQREWEERQREYEERRRQYEAYEAEERRNRRSGGRRMPHSSRCRCPECMMSEFFSFFGNGSFYFDGNGGFFFAEDDDDDDFFDREWNRINQNKQELEDKKAADCLGVAVDASLEEIKRVYRRKALRYHPDKYSEDLDMTAEEAEEHFKELSSAYDHLVANFD